MLNDLFDLTYPEENLFPQAYSLQTSVMFTSCITPLLLRVTVRLTENLGPYTGARIFLTQLRQARTGRTGFWEPDRSSTAYRHCRISSYFLIRTMFKDPRKQIRRRSFAQHVQNIWFNPQLSQKRIFSKTILFLYVYVGRDKDTRTHGCGNQRWIPGIPLNHSPFQGVSINLESPV